MTSEAHRADPDISVIVTGHREGDGCLPTLTALARTLEVAAVAGLVVEVLGVLDRADDATVAVFARALGGSGIVGRLAAGRTLTTDHGDPGAARNEGVLDARGEWVCVLDGDNLPSRTWLREAHRVASGHGAPCVVHPEQLVIFGQRWQVWPQLPSDDPAFNAHNFFDRTYWDTFCLASRDVFVSVPYASTAAERGLGPEDWHWGMETLHAGYAHLVAPGTALLYRDKSSGSVQGGHVEAQSLLPPSALLVDPLLASSVRPDESHPEWRGLQSAIVGGRRPQDQEPGPGPVPARDRWWKVTSAVARRRRLEPDQEPVIDVHHYRALNADALRLPDGEALAHFRDVGRRAGLRTALTVAELRDVTALDLTDYADLHPDLVGMDDDALLHHYLAHGRGEGRATSRNAEERDDTRPVTLEHELVAELSALRKIEPAIPEPTADALAALRRTGPPPDGSTTRGSRAWWRVVRALGAPPEVIVFLGQAPAPDSGTAVECAALMSAATRERPVAVVTTSEGPARPPGALENVTWVDLPAMDEWRQLAGPERRRLLATLVVQLRPGVVHSLDSGEFAAALSDHGPALRASTRVQDRAAGPG